MKEINLVTNFLFPDLYIVLNRETENKIGEVTK